MVKRVKCVTVAMSCRFGQSSAVASRTHVWLAASQWKTDIVCACACVVPAGSAKDRAAGGARRGDRATAPALVAVGLETRPQARNFGDHNPGAPLRRAPRPQR